MVEKLGFGFRIANYFRQFRIFCETVPYLRKKKIFLYQITTHMLYFFSSPYKMLDIQSNPYGETPYKTLKKIAKKFQIVSTDHVIDFDCGRGLSLLFWNQIVQAKATGVDNFSLFIERAKMIQKGLYLDGIEFRNQDFIDVDLKGITVIYIYGTALKDEIIMQLAKKFEQLPSSVKIIVVSFSFEDYSKKFKTEKELIGSFPWGKAPIYLCSVV